MLIQTSYFAMLRRMPEGFIPVSVAAWPPKGFRGGVFRRFWPSERLLRDYKAGAVDEDGYIARFERETLDLLPERDILLGELSRFGDKILLCCYERSDAFCHRHLVSERLREMGIDCHEWHPQSMASEKTAAPRP